jgi:DNA repair protein RecO (recombination protein O)
MYLKTQGLVLRVTDYNDKDALLTLLTPNHGKLTVKARGLRRKNSPLIGPCQLLAYGEYVLFDYKGNLTINEATSIELFQHLRRDLCALSLGSYFAQAAELICQEDLPNPELLSLVLNCLYGLSKLGISQEKVKAVFELRVACLAGYMPDLSGCHNCGSEHAELFDLAAGRLECRKCRSGDSVGIRMPVSPGLIQAMYYIVNCDPKRLFSFDLSDEGLSALSQITEGYLCTQLERGFSALDFYKSLLI